LQNIYKVGNSTLEIVLNDITEMSTDAIVNAANSSLLGGGGVDGAIHRKGGKTILEECKNIRLLKYPNGLPTGDAIITSAGNLKAKFIIHTVGPIWKGGMFKEKEFLKKAYESSLELASKKRLNSISFPSISTGTYNYPTKEASLVALKTIINFLQKKSINIKVFFVLYSERTFKIYLNTANNIIEKMKLNHN
jgi:O-acetyl-ADP-ribose deacetylase (regulator of RNase III)